MQRPRKMYDRATIGMCRRRWWPAAIRRGSFALTTTSAALVRHSTPIPLLPILSLAALLPSATTWAQKAAPSPLGIFRGESDVGRPSVLGAGSLRYDPKSKAYVVTGGGAN